MQGKNSSVQIEEYIGSKDALSKIISRIKKGAIADEMIELSEIEQISILLLS